MTIDDITAEYNRLASRVPTSVGQTAAEIVTLTGWSFVKVRKFLKAGLLTGSIELTTKTVTGISGVAHPIPAYIIRRKKNANSRS